MNTTLAVASRPAASAPAVSSRTFGVGGDTCARRWLGHGAGMPAAQGASYAVLGTGIAAVFAAAHAADVAPTANRGTDRKVDVKGARAWSPPV